MVTKHAVIRRWHVPGQEISGMVTPETLRHGIIERLDCVMPMQPSSMHSFDASSWPLPIPDTYATGRFCAVSGSTLW